MGTSGGVPIPCYPFYSLMLALNSTKVDYFSLDIEGAEYPVLASLPFDKVDVSVLSVEIRHGRSPSDTKAMMRGKGYHAAQELYYHDHDQHLSVEDVIFVKRNSWV